jgi:membrane associated rhomboid family serine protease
MGIYDRDYIRREGPSFLGSFADRGTVCKWLIAINVVVFIVQVLTLQRTDHLGVPLAHPEAGPVTTAFELDVSRVMAGEVWRLLTYAFLHSVSSPMHIIFNMLFLWWFGSEVEDIYRPREFLAIYLTGAVLGGIAYCLTALAGGHQLIGPGGHPLLDAAGRPIYLPCIGASAAVTTVLVLCAIHYPTRVIYLFFVLPIPIWAFVVFAVAKDALTFFGRLDTSVAVDAHLAGAAFGLLYYKAGWRLTELWPSFQGWRRRRAQPRLRVFREEEEEAPTPVSVVAAPPRLEDEQLEAKMDAVLEKLSRVGKENLTESEREVLLRASEVFKRRRT